MAALCELRQQEPPPAVESAIRMAVAKAAEALGNTPAICRKSYVHPAILDAFRNDHRAFARTNPDEAEAAVLRLLRRYR
jgi:DNA topoisomerase-1